MIKFEVFGFTDNEVDLEKSSFSIFVAILYIKVVYMLVMIVNVLSHYDEDRLDSFY